MMETTTYKLGYGCRIELIERDCGETYVWLGKLHTPDDPDGEVCQIVGESSNGVLRGLMNMFMEWQTHNQARIALWDLVHYSGTDANGP